jgi:hypothetical protein
MKRSGSKEAKLRVLTAATRVQKYEKYWVIFGMVIL